LKNSRFSFSFECSFEGK